MPTFSGKVIEGKKRGKELGFPTANIPLSISVHDGIYISMTTHKKKTYPSLTFIGAAKTFNETTYQSETYIFDFSENVYGEELTVELLKKIRGNKKFDSQKELVLQMEEDKKNALEYFKQQENI